ncbi:MAG: hypothetical protein M1142_03725 [Patescibacteria group bacterium]|nr:hypothetical protein [Patescibacteria group bacterium]
MIETEVEKDLVLNNKKTPDLQLPSRRGRSKWQNLALALPLGAAITIPGFMAWFQSVEAADPTPTTTSSPKPTNTQTLLPEAVATAHQQLIDEQINSVKATAEADLAATRAANNLTATAVVEGIVATRVARATEKIEKRQAAEQTVVVKERMATATARAIIVEESRQDNTLGLPNWLWWTILIGGSAAFLATRWSRTHIWQPIRNGLRRARDFIMDTARRIW